MKKDDRVLKYWAEIWNQKQLGRNGSEARRIAYQKAFDDKKRDPERL